jgi:serine/threonine-protein kinase
MTGRRDLKPSHGELDPSLEQLLDDLIERLQAGEEVDLEAVIQQHPEHAEPIRRMVPALEALVDYGETSAPRDGRRPGAAMEAGTAAKALGDFRLLREVGRGGMGIVYEAEQVSLGRRVALKLLPMAAAMDPRQIQRFRIEAQAAACLHHPHIVPVHGVGVERGVHYYAMQLIDGRSLAAMIAELRRLDGLDPDDGPVADLAAISTTDLAARLLSGGAAGQPGGAGSDSPTVALPASASPPQAPAPLLPSPLAGAGPTPRSGGEGPKGRMISPSPLAGEGGPKGRMRGIPDGQKPPAKSPSSTSTRTREYVRNAARLALQAAEALDHAHARGILHRDIKPANLLLDAEGRLWVTDFGLAQVRGDDRLTLTGDVLGTLRYMSPEQALGRRVVIDGRTDLYSLGVTLYELLTLHPAVDGHDRAEILRRIAEQEPIPLRRLNPAVPADLETIVLKATAKDPAGRYATAQELAEDLGNFLADRPILARRPGLLDRAAKLSRRHRSVVTTAALFLVLGTAVSTWMAVRATRAERTAIRERNAATDARDAEGRARKRAEDAEKTARTEGEKAKAINEFLVNDLLVRADPGNNHDLLVRAEPGKEAPASRITLREALDRAAEKVGERFRDLPLVEAALRTTISDTYHGLAAHTESRKQAAIALVIYERERGPEAVETLNAVRRLGHALEDEEKHDEAEPLLRRSLDGLSHALGKEHPDTLHAMDCLACVYQNQGKLSKAEQLFAKGLEISRRVRGEEHRDTLLFMEDLAVLYFDERKFAHAETLFVKVLEGRRRILGEAHPDTIRSIYNLAGVYKEQVKLAQAEPLLVKVLEIGPRVQGETHPDMLTAARQLGHLYLMNREFARSIPLLEDVLRWSRDKLGPDHPDTLNTMGNLGDSYLAAISHPYNSE